MTGMTGMTHTTLPASTLDALDRAFLWRADQARQWPTESLEIIASRAETEGLEVSAVAAVREAEPAPAAVNVAAMAASSAAAATTGIAVPAPGEDSLVDRLLRTVPDAWSHLAQRVEDAHRDGGLVIAVTGARHGEGRTTLVECLRRTLLARGRRVACCACAPVDVETVLRADDPGGCIVLVDAGIWFPGGPLRRGWLERQSLGCNAVILVRRADQPECPARGVALEAVGLKVIGEVLTMSPPATTAIRVT
jgi:hypothetical protein